MKTYQLKITILLLIPIVLTVLVIIYISSQKKLTPEERILEYVWKDKHAKDNYSEDFPEWSKQFTINKIKENSQIAIYSLVINNISPEYRAYYNYYKDNKKVSILLCYSLMRKVEYENNIDLKYCVAEAIDLNEFNNFYSEMNLSKDSLVDSYCKLLVSDNLGEECIRVNSPNELKQVLIKKREKLDPRLSKDSLFLRNDLQLITNFDFLNNKEKGVYYYYYSHTGLVRFEFLINRNTINRVNSSIIGKTISPCFYGYI